MWRKFWDSNVGIVLGAYIIAAPLGVLLWIALDFFFG